MKLSMVDLRPHRGLTEFKTNIFGLNIATYMKLTDPTFDISSSIKLMIEGLDLFWPLLCPGKTSIHKSGLVMCKTEQFL